MVPEKKRQPLSLVYLEGVINAVESRSMLKWESIRAAPTAAEGFFTELSLNFLRMGFLHQ